MNILMASGGNAGCRPVWLDVDVADQHAGCPSRPAGGLIPPTYWLDQGRYTRRTIPSEGREGSRQFRDIAGFVGAELCLRRGRIPQAGTTASVHVVDRTQRSAAVRVARKPLADRASVPSSRIASASLVQQGSSTSGHADPQAFAAELEQVMERGYATDEGEHELGVGCVAVAVPRAPSRIALSITGPATRMTDEMVARAVPLWADAARRFSDDLASGQPWASSNLVAGRGWFFTPELLTIRLVSCELNPADNTSRVSRAGPGTLTSSSRLPTLLGKEK